MPQRVRPAPAGRAVRQTGFTLLELVVVVLIIGILATLVTLSIGNRGLDDRLELESARLAKLVQLAEDEADLKGTPIGLRFTDTGYQFVALDPSHKWVDYAQGGPLKPRTLQQPFYVELKVEGRVAPPAIDPAKAAKSGKDKDRDEGLKPQILLLPGGQMTAFTLEVRAPRYPSFFRIEGDVLGRVTRERFYERT